MCSWERLRGSKIFHIHICLMNTALVPSSGYITEQGICQSFNSAVGEWFVFSFSCSRSLVMDDCVFCFAALEIRAQI